MKTQEWVLPQNYVELTEDEMMYLDGGISLPDSVVGFAINSGINFALAVWMGGGGGYALARAAIARIGAGQATRFFTRALTRFVSIRIANAIGGGIVGTILGVGSLSVGGVIAKNWDAHDRHKNNGWVDI